jgi:two-component system repressor protein LuxO
MAGALTPTQATAPISPAAVASARILIVEDSASQAELARLHLAGLGHQTDIVGTAAAARDWLRDTHADAILLDIELPDGSGLDILRSLRADGDDAAVIVVTANASINAAVEAMRAGATDFLVKPYARARLAVTLANALEKRSLLAQLSRVQAQLGRDRFFGFIGASERMQAVYRTIENVAQSRASVFITGESGTGKELAAEAIHRASPRAQRRFVALNCGAIPRDLLESEVFGHVKGAFTGAVSDREGAAKLADGGTLFLDEIGEMPLAMQVKLLRFVQTGSFNPVGTAREEHVDVRFVCATNRDPMLEVKAGRFREDLYYRLYVVPLELPPLRDRGEDVLLIARHFLAQFSREEKRSFREFDADAEAVLRAYRWPGNVRQLQNAVRNVVVLNDATTVTAAMLPPPLRAAPPGISLGTGNESPDAASSSRVGIQPGTSPPAGETLDAPSPDSPSLDLGDIVTLALMEKRLILAALARTDQDVQKAAVLLDISPSTIYRKLAQWKA